MQLVKAYSVPLGRFIFLCDLRAGYFLSRHYPSSRGISGGPGRLSLRTRRAFKATFGESFSKYIIRPRTERAQELMIMTDEPLSQIALLCGLGSRRTSHESIVLGSVPHQVPGDANGATRRLRDEIRPAQSFVNRTICSGPRVTQHRPLLEQGIVRSAWLWQDS